MSDLKILHAADLHLDSPFEGLGAAKAAQRRDEQRRLLHRIARLAEEESVDIVLLAGDLRPRRLPRRSGAYPRPCSYLPATTIFTRRARRMRA